MGACLILSVILWNFCESLDWRQRFFRCTNDVNAWHAHTHTHTDRREEAQTHYSCCRWHTPSAVFGRVQPSGRRGPGFALGLLKKKKKRCFYVDDGALMAWSDLGVSAVYPSSVVSCSFLFFTRGLR